MKAIGTWRSVLVSVLACAVSVSFGTPIGAQEARGEDPAAAALVAQRGALAESILAAKEEARGEGFEATTRASLKSRMEALAVEQLAALAEKGAVANITSALGATAADLVYTPVTPCRVFDSRVSQGGPGPIPANTQRNVFVAGTLNFPAQGGLAGGCGVPVGATSAIINFVAASPSGIGNLRAWAVASPQPAAPLAAVMNFGVVAGLPALANGVAVPICNPAATSCTLGDLRLQANASSTEVLGDVVGYFRAPTGGFISNAFFVYGHGLDPTSSSDFIGPVATVTVTATQKVHVWSSKALGAGATAATSLNLGMCYKSTVAGATIIAIGARSLGYTAPANQRLSYSLSGVWGPVAAGTYSTGLCGSSVTPENWNNNEYGYTSAQVIN